MEFRKWEWPCLAGVAALFVAIRAPLYTMPGLVLGWNSDSALFGLMARAMRSGIDVPVFFWGQHYLGTLTSLLTAWFPSPAIGPFALRFVAASEIALAIVLYWLALRRTFGRSAAMIAACWLAAGPAFLFHFTIAPIAEQLFLAAAAVFWYATRATFTRSAEWFVTGLLCGAAMWLHQFVIFLMAAIGVALIVERLVSIRRLAWGAAGFAIGYAPAAVELLRDDPVLYKRTILSWDLYYVGQNLADTLRTDAWTLLADATPFGIAVALCILVLAVAGFRSAPRSRARLIVLGTIACSAAFWILTTYPYIGAVRYIAPIVPMIYGAAAFAIVKRPRAWAVAAAIAIAIGLYVPRIAQARDVAAARSERYTNWPGAFDPRPVLAELRSGGYHVCYGEVWVAHKLEWISEPAVRFVPVRSVHRTLPLSLFWIREPGPKCFVDNDGRVTRLTPAEDAYWAGTVIERARKLTRFRSPTSRTHRPAARGRNATAP